MPAWLVYLPSILSALVEFGKFLVSLVDKKDIKSCSIALEDARRTGDTQKLQELIDKMKRGESC